MNAPPPRPAAPLAQHRCPLCGGPNDCAVAKSGRFDTPCWCRDVHFDERLLARVPAAKRGLACLCERCARTGLKDAKTGG